MSDITELNVETGEVTVRSYTKEEIKAREIHLAEIAAEQEKLQLTAAAKAAVLAKLGLTLEEAAALLG
jgi:hypothetical protein